MVAVSGQGKDDSMADGVWPFRQVDAQWASTCIANGVGSGEGLIERIADEQMVLDKEGVAKVIPGATDNRCLLRLSELSRCFKLGRRENATLSEHLREAWDGEPIHVPNRKKTGNALASTGYAISVLSSITPGVLAKMLATGTEAFDGFANRFLWARIRIIRYLPDGGDINVLKPFLARLADTLAFAKSAGEMNRDSEARRLWNQVYPALLHSGDSVPHTDRARAYAVRLAMLYALADKSTTIRVEHLRAALAVWDYCRQSARLLFSDKPEKPKPDEPWRQVLNAITSEPGIHRSELLRDFRSLSADALDGILAYLECSGLAHRRQCQGGGRPAECWFPGREPEGEGEKDDNPLPSKEEHASASPTGRKEQTPGSVAEPNSTTPEGGKEGSKSGQEAGQGDLLPSFPASGAQAKAESEGSYFLPSHASAEETRFRLEGNVGVGEEGVVKQQAESRTERGLL
jgi:hypothetical protein